MTTTQNTLTYAFEIENVGFCYTQNTPILTNINLRVAIGSLLAIVGPNGGGKTTLLKLLLGLLTPDTGKIQVLGHPPGDHKAHIGYVPQNSAVRPDFPVTVTDVVRMGIPKSSRFSWSSASKEKEMAAAALHQSGIETVFFSRRFDRLSGGQKQRVLIARALVGNPQLLVFDEPTSNIDPEGRFCFFDLMEKLKKRLTIVVVSHDLSIVASRVTDIACVNKKIIHNDQGTMTREMLALMYGAHDHSCPMADYMQEVSTIMNIFPQVEHHV